MLKLLLILTSTVLIALAMLQLRQQRAAMTNDLRRMHASLEDCQQQMWERQLAIATYTSPAAMPKVLER